MLYAMGGEAGAEGTSHATGSLDNPPELLSPPLFKLQRPVGALRRGDPHQVWGGTQEQLCDEAGARPDMIRPCDEPSPVWLMYGAGLRMPGASGDTAPWDRLIKFRARAILLHVWL